MSDRRAIVSATLLMFALQPFFYSGLSKTVGSVAIGDFVKAHSRVRLNTRYFLVLTKLKFDRKLVKIPQKKLFVLEVLRRFFGV
ncbi:hypothetical protein QUA54_06540 [Microcoleus sp. MOSTC5]|uniref:hypothetical protein n=1 Tax=Microcoleus sp. MOSTC5 TaxID=3055378 RepID=UPI002FCFD361